MRHETGKRKVNQKWKIIVKKWDFKEQFDNEEERLIMIIMKPIQMHGTRRGGLENGG